MLRFYVSYCILAVISSFFFALVIWDTVIANGQEIVVPGYVVPAPQQPLTT